MTAVALDIAVPTASGALERAVGHIRFVPTRRRTAGATVVLPAAFTVEVTGATVPVVELAPTGPDWAWWVKENLQVEHTRVVAVPDTADTVEYSELVDVDPDTLDPAAEPTAAWYLELRSIELTPGPPGAKGNPGQPGRDGIDGAPAGNRAVFLGDSITYGNGNENAAGEMWSHTMPSVAHWLSRGRLLRARNAGVPGNTVAQMLARFDADVTPAAPSVVVVMAGTNDSNDAVATPLNDYAESIAGIVARCRAIGARPVLCTVPPNATTATRRARVLRYNAWLKRWCGAQGVTLVDTYAALVDPITGGFRPAYHLDGTHPNNPGYYALGAAVWAALSGLVSGVDGLLPQENADPHNLVPNGLNLTTTGTGTSLMPTGWSVQTSVHPAGVTGSLVTGDATIKGNWWKVAAAGATATNNEFMTISGIVPGHVYAHVGRFKATGLRNADTGPGSQVLIGAAFNSALLVPGRDFRAVSSIAYDVPEGWWYQEMVAPPDASTLLVRRQLLNTTAGAGTLQVAQVGVYDLTAMGLTP